MVRNKFIGKKWLFLIPYFGKKPSKRSPSEDDEVKIISVTKPVVRKPKKDPISPCIAWRTRLSRGELDRVSYSPYFQEVSDNSGDEIDNHKTGEDAVEDEEEEENTVKELQAIEVPVDDLVTKQADTYANVDIHVQDTSCLREYSSGSKSANEAKPSASEAHPTKMVSKNNAEEQVTFVAESGAESTSDEMECEMFPALQCEMDDPPANKTTEERDDNGDFNTTDTNTNASTSVEVKEQGREKEKEQVEPSGLSQEKETAFKPSGSAEDMGASSRAANVRTLTVRCELSQPNADEEFKYPDAQFYNFAMNRTSENFKKGDIWALYSDLDTFPKYYGSICKVEYDPLKVHINWLEACPKSEMERAWLNANFPISCGKFRFTTQNITYDHPNCFSHLVSVRHHDRGNYYEILPEVGEIWAIYSNWSDKWTPHDFKICKFLIVEIIEHIENSIRVCSLRQVPELRSLFMQEDDRTGSVTQKIPESEYIRFSHKIPAFCLNEKCEGKHKLWELDPASVPPAFLYHDL